MRNKTAIYSFSVEVLTAIFGKSGYVVNLAKRYYQNGMIVFRIRSGEYKFVIGLIVGIRYSCFKILDVVGRIGGEYGYSIISDILEKIYGKRGYRYKGGYNRRK